MAAQSVRTDEILGIIDADFHPMPVPTDPQVWQHVPQRWRDYITKYGLGYVGSGTMTPAQRQFTHRLDALDANGRVGVDPLWAREQVLDKFDMTAAILTCPQSYIIGSTGLNNPNELAMSLCRAYNDALVHTWMAADPRYYAAIVIPRDLPNVADEIRRCKEGPGGDRFVQVLMSPGGQEPLGRQRYWPIFEACVHYGLPLAFHVPGLGRQGTANGSVSFYCESHMNFAALPMAMLPSLVFEGVFDRFPQLKIVLVELGWSWAPAFAWRLDATWEKLRDEVPHVARRPSEYLREHLWFTTQPLEEPEHRGDTRAVFELFEDAGFGERLMYSSDYPHWDYDSPYESVPRAFPIERRRRVLGQNASKLYGIPLKARHGIPADAAA
jgi:predicted TIM-barrel fold metal-dependent hydrolase